MADSRRKEDAVNREKRRWWQVRRRRSNKVNLRREKIRMRLKWVVRKVRPLDWHKRRKRGGVWLTRSLRNKRQKRKERKRKWREVFNKVLKQVKLRSLRKEIKDLQAQLQAQLGNVDTLVLEVEQCNAESTKDNEGAVLDSGAMCMSGDAARRGEAKTRTPLASRTVVRGVNGDAKAITHQFRMNVPSAVEGMDVELENALDIPGSIHDLVSVGKLDDAGLTVIFKDGEGKVLNDQGKLLMYAKKIGGLYRLTSSLVDQCPKHVINYSAESLRFAHEALGHRAFNVVRKMLNLPKESPDCPNPVCESCLYASTKAGRKRPEGLTRAPRYGYRLHSDTSAKLPAATHPKSGGISVQRYVLTVDERTDSMFVDFVSRKSDVKRKIISRVDKINNDRGKGEGVVEHQTDGGTEFINKWLDQELARRNVEPRNSQPHVKYENGFIEAHMKEVKLAGRAMMFRGSAPDQLWPFSIQHAVRLHDLLPDPITGLTPYERRTGLEPRSADRPKNLAKGGKLFCKCYAKLYVRNNLERDAIPCIWLGKDTRSPSDLVIPIGGKRSGKKVKAAEVVNFDPECFPYAEQLVPVPDELKNLNYASDSEQEEDGIDVVDEDGSGSDDEVTGDEVEEEGSRVEERRSTLRNKLNESEDEPNVEEEKDEPDGKIGGEDAWELEEIVGEEYRMAKGGKKGAKKKKTKYYQVKWKGDYPLDWLHCSRIRAPELLAKWKKKKEEAEDKLVEMENLVMRVCQFNQEVEVVPQKLAQENPFKDLFDPMYDKRINPPKGYKAMLNHPFAQHFLDALIREKLENKKWNTYVEVPRSQVPKGTKILNPVTAYDIKYNERGEICKFKSRVCLDGSRTTVHESETYEAIAGTGTIRMLLCLAARYGLGIAQTDVKNFFLQAALPEGKEYYARIPDGWAENDPETHVAKVLAPWYGLKEAAKLAGDQLGEIMKKAGMEENPYLPKVFFKWRGDEFVCCATHIDDGLWVFSDRKFLDEILDEVDKSFKMERTYNVKKILGIEIDYEQDRGIMKIHQGTYNVAKLMEMEVKNAKKTESPGFIPTESSKRSVFTKTQTQATEKEIRLFQKKVGVHMWGLQTDPSAMFVVHRLMGRPRTTPQSILPIL